MSYKTIAGLAPTMMAAGLATHSYKLAKKKKKRASDFLTGGVGIIGGTALLQAESQLVGSL